MKAAPTPQSLAADLRSGDRARIKRAQRHLGVADDGIPGPVTHQALAARADGVFPLPKLPTAINAAWSWRTGARAFAANRSGNRAHAGDDLYSPQGTPVYAVLDGKVLRVADFYAGTLAVEVDHGLFVARYGEVQRPKVRKGDVVQRGQQIAEVGHLVGIRVPSDMLHFELYAGTVSGSLTQKQRWNSRVHRDGRAFYRRKDLLDPTDALDAWAARLPS